MKEIILSTQLSKFVPPALVEVSDATLGGGAEAVALGHVARVLFLLIWHGAAVASVLWWNAIAGPAHAASLPALCAPALGPDSPLGPVTLWHVTGALLFLVRHGASKAAVIRRNTVTSPGISASASTKFTRANAPLSPLSKLALGHVTGTLLFLIWHGASKAAIIRRNTVTSPGIGACASTKFTRANSPFSPVSVRTLGHVASLLFFIGL